jgi:hypothetical protein
VTSGAFREENFFFVPALGATGGLLVEETVGGAVELLAGDLTGGAGGITEELAGLEAAGRGEVETGIEETCGTSEELLSEAGRTTKGSDDPDLSNPDPMLPAPGSSGLSGGDVKSLSSR